MTATTVTELAMPAVHPVTPNEADVLVACEGGGGLRYHVPVHLRFRPGVDVDRLARAVAAVIERHPRLRSGFTRLRGELVRLEHAHVAFVVDPGPGGVVPSLTDEAWADAVGSIPFRLDSAPLLRCHVRRGDDGDLVVLVLHHAVCDGWSASLVADELVRRYLDDPGVAGRADEFSVSTDAATNGNEVLSGTPDQAARRTEGLRFWERQAVGEPLRPITDLASSADATGAPDHHVTAPVSSHALRQIRETAAVWRTSPAVLGMVCWQIAMHAWSGRQKGYSFLVVAGRGDHDDQVVGHFSRALPLATELSPSRTLRQRVQEGTGAVLDAWEHAEINVSDVPSLVGIRPSESSVYLHARESDQSWQADGVTVVRYEPDSANAKFGFSGAFIEGDDDAEFAVDVHAALYRRETAVRVAAQVVRMIERLGADDRDELTELDLLLAADEPSLVAGIAARHDSLLELVREHVRNRPDAPGIRRAGDPDSMTYAELWSRACAVASAVAASAVGQGPVALLTDPAPDTFVTWLGVVLAGRAYLPLDPAFPDAQLVAILEVAGPSLVIESGEADRGGRIAAVGVPVVHQADLASAPVPDHEPSLPDPATPMCVLFTSGSTGTPKGVVLPQRGLARLMQPEFLDIGDDETFSQLSPLNFDGASYEVWGALAQGACLVVIDKSTLLDPPLLRAVVRAEGVTTMLMTTPLLNRVVEDAPDLLATVRRVYFGGELISVDHIRTALEHGGPGRLVHSYGPTENSFTSTRRTIDTVAHHPRTIPIGTPVPGTRAVVVIEGTTVPAPLGMPGELLVDGLGVADGYLGDPTRDAESFVQVEEEWGDGGRAYRTGDRARLLPGGELEFLGRWDNQVKVRSQRVELGEVEHVLRTHPDLSDVVVSTVGIPKELVAHCVPRHSGLTERAVRDHAAQRLPRFAVPRYVALRN